MNENDLIQAGFKRVDVKEEDVGEKDWFYYEYHFNEHLSLLAYRNDNAKYGSWEWEVDFFEPIDIRFDNLDKLVSIVWLKENPRIK